MRFKMPSWDRRFSSFPFSVRRNFLCLKSELNSKTKTNKHNTRRQFKIELVSIEFSKLPLVWAFPKIFSLVLCMQIFPHWWCCLVTKFHPACRWNMIFLTRYLSSAINSLSSAEFCSQIAFTFYVISLESSDFFVDKLFMKEIGTLWFCSASL